MIEYFIPQVLKKYVKLRNSISFEHFFLNNIAIFIIAIDVTIRVKNTTNLFYKNKLEVHLNTIFIKYCSSKFS